MVARPSPAPWRRATECSWASAPVRCLSPSRPVPYPRALIGRAGDIRPPRLPVAMVNLPTAGMPACRTPSGPWRSYHGGRSPPPSLIPGAHQVPARAMGEVWARLGGCECSCESFFGDGGRSGLLTGGKESEFNGLARTAGLGPASQLRKGRKFYPRARRIRRIPGRIDVARHEFVSVHRPWRITPSGRASSWSFRDAPHFRHPGIAKRDPGSRVVT